MSRLQSSPRQTMGERTPIEEFFARYPSFPYDPSQSAMLEFYRMSDYFHWEREDVDRELARELHKDAMTQQFNHIYGTDVDDIASWWKLCEDLRIDPMPRELDACRDAVKNTYVNLVDLTDTLNTFQHAELFPSEQDLSSYTMATGKYFPKDNAYAGGVLKFLLRQILNPPTVDARRGRRSSGQRARSRRRRGRGRPGRSA